MGIPLCVIYCFSLDAFNIYCLCLTFVSLINMCLGVFCLGFFLFWKSLGFLDLGGYFFPHIRDVLIIISLGIFSCPFFLSSFYWDTYDSNVRGLNIVLEVS